jgi:hypothetical protein
VPASACEACVGFGASERNALPTRYGWDGMIKLLVAMIAVTVSVGVSARSASVQGSDIDTIVSALPGANAMRAAWEAGKRGDGIHRAWMDQMRAQGVKEAWIVVYTGLRHIHSDAEVLTSSFYNGYTGGASQIVDSGSLRRIRESGLEAELDAVAIGRALESPWYDENTTKIPVQLFDNEWLPATTPSFGAAQHRLKSVSVEVPADSSLRNAVPAMVGVGPDMFYMAQMRQLRVQRAVASVWISFDSGHPRELKLEKLEFYRNYGDRFPLASREALAQIRKQGLDSTLRTAALDSAAHGSWLDVPQPRPETFEGGTRVELFDDPWLTGIDHPIYFVTTNR